MGCRLSPAERFGSFVYGLKSGAFGFKSWAIAPTQGQGDLSNIHRIKNENELKRTEDTLPRTRRT